jgi:hypothetical protein
MQMPSEAKRDQNDKASIGRRTGPALLPTEQIWRRLSVCFPFGAVIRKGGILRAASRHNAARGPSAGGTLAH